MFYWDKKENLEKPKHIR